MSTDDVPKFTYWNDTPASLLQYRNEKNLSINLRLKHVDNKLIQSLELMISKWDKLDDCGGNPFKIDQQHIVNAYLEDAIPQIKEALEFVIDKWLKKNHWLWNQYMNITKLETGYVFSATIDSRQIAKLSVGLNRTKSHNN